MISPVSIGWRRESSTCGVNSGNSSRNSTPPWASEASPGRALSPPPTRAAIEAEWCGWRNGRRFERAPPFSSPATDWIIETSSSSRGPKGGRIEGRRAASIDLPAPGGPFISRLWPPAAAISRARLAPSWPLMSRRSDIGPAGAATAGCGRAITWLPLKWLASWISERGASTSMSPAAQAASGPVAAGQIKPRPRPLAAIAAGSTPATAVIEPSSASSPSTQ